MPHYDDLPVYKASYDLFLEIFRFMRTHYSNQKKTNHGLVLTHMQGGKTKMMWRDAGKLQIDASKRSSTSQVRYTPHYLCIEFENMKIIICEYTPMAYILS